LAEFTAHVDLPLTDHAPRVARAGIRATLAGWGFTDPEWLDAAALVVSELVSNAVRHGGGCLALELSAHDDHVTVAAVDGSAVVPRRRDAHGRPDIDGGRGLAIIEASVQRWGVQDHHGGKRVWVLLAPYPFQGQPGAPRRPGTYRLAC
jgi:anti-sigma regulatory factor (Ser/Thr protein kinase)